MTFKIYLMDFGFKLNGTDYSFPHVDSVEVEDPERNRLTRGANASNTTGIVFKEGLKDPKRWTVIILGMSAELYAALLTAMKEQTRLDVYGVDRKDGSSKWLKNAILSNAPTQGTINDSAESMNVSLEFESFENEEVHKS